MAYADGEANAQDASEIVAAAAADPEVERRISMFRNSRRLAKSAMPLEPVPMDLEAKIRAMAQKAQAAAGPAAEPAQTRVLPVANDNAPRWRMPLAACILFALGIGSGYMIRGTGAPQPGDVNIAGLIDGQLKMALESVASGGELSVDDGKFRAIASFRDAKSNFCREFERDRGTDLSYVGVACHTGGTWSVNTVIASGQTSEGYAPASSLDAIDAYIAAIGASDLMAPEEEQAALAAIKAGQ